MHKIKYCILALAIIFCTKANCQTDSAQATLNDSVPLNPKRVRGLIIGSTLTYSAWMVGLNELWYKNYPKGPMHFINDNHEWLQLDKAGHCFSAYGESVLFLNALKWAGVPHKKAAWIGGSYGFFAQTVIEILDGHSAEWGASSGDLIANTMGSAIVISQELAWKQQRIRIKTSNHPTKHPEELRYRTDALYGSNYSQAFMKDYNGQTFWISANINDFNKNNLLPKWLNVAIGYGGENIYGGDNNTWDDGTETGNRIDRTDIPRYRQYYLSLDVDLRYLRTNNKVWNTFVEWFNVLKVPFPAIEYNKVHGFKMHALYF